ncbi:MAG: LysM peptidoglycan-binding domain-containing protein, partial [Alphaproteobacteria bacterium]|nr:LysM peptidoglycan-binding domain-containing protein [Alphaproteobacteria bacterium]
VFVYVSEAGAENSVSLLMTRDGSTLLQAPSMLRDGDLSISKIDYLDNGRIVVTGDALPRLRVSLALNDKYMGFARVSDHHHFGLGADVGELKSGAEYSLTVRMHDGDGRTVASVTHDFVMPEMTGDDDTFYTVRRGDCLWIIARNFMRRGILFSIIAERNNIENPDLIYPKQLLQIPVEK